MSFPLNVFSLLNYFQYDETERRREMAKNSLERYTHYYERWATNQSVGALSDYIRLLTFKFLLYFVFLESTLQFLQNKPCYLLLKGFLFPKSLCICIMPHATFFFPSFLEFGYNEETISFGLTFAMRSMIFC